MASLAYLDVIGAGDAETVTAEIARLLDGPPPISDGDGWEVRLGSDPVSIGYALDDDPEQTGGYPVSMGVFARGGDEATEATARWLYDTLAARTSWGLRLHGIGVKEIASRAAVTNVA